MQSNKVGLFRAGEFDHSPAHKTINIMKYRHFLYICVVASILMFASCSDTETYNVAPENGLNVRATPSKNGKIIGKLNLEET